jgi:hypothetical protein
MWSAKNARVGFAVNPLIVDIDDLAAFFCTAHHDPTKASCPL